MVIIIYFSAMLHPCGSIRHGARRRKNPSDMWIYRYPRLLFRGLVGLAALIILALLIVLLVEPDLPYTTRGAVPQTRSPDFIDLLSHATDQVPVKPGKAILLTEGARFYPVRLAKIQQTKKSRSTLSIYFSQNAGQPTLLTSTAGAYSRRYRCTRHHARFAE